MLIAIAFERAAQHPDIRHAADGEHGVFLRVGGDRLQRRAVRELERHAGFEPETLIAGGIHQIGAVGHDNGAAGSADRVDRGLDGGGVVAAPVAFRALVSDIDEEAGVRRRIAGAARAQFCARPAR
jgi:hypothetical protein